MSVASASESNRRCQVFDPSDGGRGRDSLDAWQPIPVGAGPVSECRVTKRGTESDRGPSTKWLGGDASDNQSEHQVGMEDRSEAAAVRVQGGLLLAGGCAEPATACMIV